jgi:ketosteroid isomerase-like protein
MRYFVLRIGVAILTFIIGLSAATIPNAFRFGASANSSAEQELLKMEGEYIQAHLRRDTAALGRILADDFTLGPTFGRTTTKSERLTLLEDSDFTFLSIDTYGVKVKVNGDKAIVMGEAVLSGRSHDREYNSGPYGFVRVCEKQNGQWKIHSVRIANDSW